MSKEHKAAVGEQSATGAESTESTGRGLSLRTITAPFSRFIERWMPAPLIFAVALTVIVVIMALAMTPATPVDVLAGWGTGLSDLLAFTTQMCLILLLGHALANTAPVRRALVAMGRLPRTSYQAYAWVTLVACAASMLTWGLALVVGGLLAREVAVQMRQRGVEVHFPLLVACAYTSMSVWSMGYSSSAPLAAATPDSFIIDTLGATIPVSETLGTWWNLVGIVVVVPALVLIMPTLRPRSGESIVQLPKDLAAGDGVEAAVAHFDDEDTSPAARMDSSRIVPLLLGLGVAAYLIWYFSTNGFALTLDIVNWSFLAALLLLSRSTYEVGQLVKNAASTVGDILLQFPLYAGIMGIMVSTGLGTLIANFFVDISNPVTFGPIAFVSAALLNIAIPSAGGQFAVQGPVMLEAAQTIGVDPAVVTMAIGYGDSITNMIQPLFALPLLAIANSRLRDIVGYTSASMLISGTVLIGVTFVAGLL
ncbi:MAG: short-chain fatty acid transporter [Brevibacterium yomogidense]|uniref:short-chain fatty acid transporter n=1 Tax=Brevibacterium sp. Mu109 TaxID=1255669 RepID=UPI000C5C5D6D|nr:TIGR00366 family protein [Brevibacterium sp. Mu109]SMX81849.1 short-chain fatty acids transporter [Brevibacterium sp. Mu109]